MALGAAWQEAEEDEEFWEDDDARVGCLAEWAHWLRDDVHVQAVAWAVASAAVLGPENSWARWPGLWDVLLFSAKLPQLLLGWLLATLLTIGWVTGRVQLVFIVGQRAMTFPPWSILIFSKFLRPEVGSVISFDGGDGLNYVRRVSAVKDAETGRYLQTAGDLPDAPADQPLYSADGCSEWLDATLVRGTMVAGPVSFQATVGVVAALLVLSPSATLAFATTSQPFLTGWISLIMRFLIVLFTNCLA